MRDFYEGLLPGMKEARESLSRINSRFALIRLLLFAAFAGLAMAGVFRHYSIILFVLSFVSLAAFIVLCVIHGRSKHMEELLAEKINAASRYLARIDGDYSILTDEGAEFISNTHPFSSDLDIFGSHSIFALYNTSHFVYGRTAFANKLKCTDFSELTGDSINRDQKIVSSLSDDPEFLLDYESIGALYSMDKIPEALIRLCTGKKKLPSALKIVYKLMPLLWVVPVVFAVLGNSAVTRVSILLIILINLIIWFVSSRNDFTDIFKAGLISKQIEAVDQRVECIFDGKKELFVPRYLDENIRSDISALMSACKLCSLREQPIMALILNAVMPYDIFCADRLYNWSLEHGDKLLRSINGLGVIESLMSTAVPGLVSKVSCFPSIVEDRKAFFEGEDMTHPLLDPSRAVSNSVVIDSKTALITGSNMSGKTTLIRTVGIMCILSYIGAKVPASKVSASVMKIMTSMRIADSLEENMSTFRAELIRIGSIVEASNDGTPMLFLIDEVFRGTNSQDRTDGAEILLNKLNKPYISGFMTTHDYALCDRAVERKDGNIVFFHFSERYEGDEVIFDYKLRSGLSHESNAKFLMRLVGIE